jgi:hypothetical protein
VRCNSPTPSSGESDDIVRRARDIQEWSKAKASLHDYNTRDLSI